jgi:hypothetical protein
MASGGNLSRESDKRVQVRDSVTSNDSSNPSLGSGASLEGYSHCIVDVIVEAGTSPTCTVRPIFGNKKAGVYADGTDRTVTSNTRFILECAGSTDLYFYIDNIGGSSTPTFSVYVEGYGRP